MYNPFIILNEKLLMMLTRQPMYFVREYYARGNETGGKFIPLLLSHYTQQGINAKRANRHFSLIKQDPYRYLYDSINEKDLQKLKIAATQPEGYRIYVNLLPKEWKPPRSLRICIYNYLDKNYPGMNGRQNKKPRIYLQDLFGKLYLVLTWQGNKVEVILDEIEKYGSCAMISPSKHQ